MARRRNRKRKTRSQQRRVRTCSLQTEPLERRLVLDATVGIAKAAELSDNSDTATFEFTFENFGTDPALNISAIDNLPGVFGAGTYSVFSVTRPSGPATFSANGLFDGSGDPELVGVGSTLLPGESATIEVMIDISGVAVGTYNNSVTATSEDSTGTMFTDDSQDGLDPDPTANGDPTDDYSLTMILVHRGIVSGTVYADFNGNGVQEPDELGIPDVEIRLTGGPIAAPVDLTVTTDPDGNYIFTSLCAGDYTLTQTQPEAFVDGPDTAGTAGGTVTDDQIQFSLATDATDASGYNFGEAGLSPSYSGKDPFLASNQGGSGAPAGETEGFTVPDPVTLEDGHLTIPATGGNDSATIALGDDKYTVTINNVIYVYDANEVDRLDFNGADGSDKVTVIGSDQDNWLWTTTTGAWFNGGGYQVDITNIETLVAIGGAGNDYALLHDSAGDDTLETFETHTHFARSDGSHVWLSDTFETTEVESRYGGHDRATFNGTLGADQFISRPQQQMAIFRNEVETITFGFDQNFGHANDLDDRALFYDTTGEDTFVGRPHISSMIGASFDNRALEFSVVSAFASGDAFDRAILFDSAGDDTFVGRADSAHFSGDGFSNRTFEFEQVKAHSSGQIGDVAVMFDSIDNDDFVSRKDYSVMRRADHSQNTIVIGFSTVHGHALEGGYDVAMFNDVTEGESLFGRDDYAQLLGRTARVTGFEHVTAETEAGHTADADLLDVDYVFWLLGTWT